MKILHILSDGPAKLSDQIIGVQSKGNEVKVIDLSKKGISYESVVDDIFSHDRVISW
ncbi:MAG: hypothetical protein HY754_06900 [Nitrospirae bacterium]|nr:hypothetical protein [Nitrospirota bacterium]